MIPRAWIVTWESFGPTPAGSLEFAQRARARGFYMMRKSMGFRVSISAVFE
jgi:hypothetical protein